RSALLCRALPPRVAAASAHRRDAGRSVRRRLVAESTRRPVDLLGVARAGSARVGGRAGAEGSGEVVELCAAGEGGNAYARIEPVVFALILGPLSAERPMASSPDPTQTPSPSHWPS